MENFSDRGIRKSVDWALVVTYLLLILIGWVNIYASIHSDGPVTIFDYNFRSGKQFVWILTALGLAALILFVKYGRGRPQTVFYDKNQDGISDWSLACDFGAPVSGSMKVPRMDFTWDDFPYLSSVSLPIIGNFSSA